MTDTIEQHVDIEVPAADAYAQWTQLTDMPRIMDHVTEVRQVDDRRLHWVIEIAGRTRTWDAMITEQIPDKRIAWTSVGGVTNAGCVTFHRLSDQRCRVMLQLEFEPGGIVEKLARGLRVIEHGVATELDNFKRFLEARDAPTGRWEGAIPSPDERVADE